MCQVLRTTRNRGLLQYRTPLTVDLRHSSSGEIWSFYFLTLVLEFGLHHVQVIEQGRCCSRRVFCIHTERRLRRLDCHPRLTDPNLRSRVVSGGIDVIYVYTHRWENIAVRPLSLHSLRSVTGERPVFGVFGSDIPSR